MSQASRIDDENNVSMLIYGVYVVGLAADRWNRSFDNSN
jgi:hypothetical protein